MKEYIERPKWARGHKYFDYCPHIHSPHAENVLTCEFCLRERVNTQNNDIKRNKIK